MAGIGVDGFTTKKQPEILEDLVLAEQVLIDPNIDVGDNTYIGQSNQIAATTDALLWEGLEQVNDNFNLDKATGKNLDDLGAIAGVPRVLGSFTTGGQLFTGEDGFSMQAGSIFENPINGDRFFLVSPIETLATSCYSALYTVKELLNNTEYSVLINTSSYNYTSDGDATELEIVTGLKAEIDADVDSNWTATLEGDALRITANSILQRIAITTITYISADEVKNFGVIQAAEEGDVVAPANSVTKVITGNNSAFISMTNPSPLVRGRLRQTDDEYRLAIGISQSTSGKATVDAITADVLGVAGVSSALVIENDLMVEDVDSRPAKSFETIVVGGDNGEVGLAIWESKGAGIQTHGAITQPIVDKYNKDRVVYFTRPQAVNLAIRVIYSKYDEETFPANGEETIQSVVVTETQALGSDVDVIPQRYNGGIYAHVAGINTLLIETQVIANSGDAPNPANWTVVKQPISATEFAYTEAVDVIVEEA